MKYLVAILELLITSATFAQPTIQPYPNAGKWQQSKPLLRERDQDRYRNSPLIQAERRGELVLPMNRDDKLPQRLLRS